MARFAGAEWRPLDKPKYILNAPDLVLCVHTMAGNLTGTDRYFRNVDVFSHFGVGGKWDADGTNGYDGKIFQWFDTAYRSAANLNGNHRVISVETADNAVRPIEPWTAKQQDSLVALMVWAHKIHGIPLIAVPDSQPGRREIAWHRLGCDPYRVAGGELWSNSWGKDCPTQARIDQIPGLIQRARDAAGPAPAPTPEVPDRMFELIQADGDPRVFAVAAGFVRQCRSAEERDVLLGSPLCAGGKVRTVNARQRDVEFAGLATSDRLASPGVDLAGLSAKLDEILAHFNPTP